MSTIASVTGICLVLGCRLPTCVLFHCSPGYWRITTRAGILGVDYPAVAKSLGEITALLKQAGFINSDPLYPIPGYKKFRFLTNFDSRVITGYMISRLQLHSGFNRTSLIFARFAAALGLLRWSSPGISVIAYKDGS